MTDKSTLPSQNPSVDETSLGYMLKLAAPMIVTYVSFTAMQFVDRFMVSSLGTAALAAILPAGIISFVPASFALGVITSVNTFVSQSLGRGNKEDCSNYCWQAILWAWLGLGGFLIIKFFPNLGAIGPWIAAISNVTAVGLANRWRFKSNRWMKIDLFKLRAVEVPVEVEAVVE